MPEAQRPSQVFVSRLREIRDRRGFSQTELAHRMTEAGRPLSKVALLRIETGKRGLSLDEALALARLLDVAPAHLLSPPDGSTVSLTNQRGVDGAGMRNWLLFGEPLLDATPTGKRALMRMRLSFALETYARALVDAKNGGDTAGVENAKRMLVALTQSHVGAIDEVSDEDAERIRIDAEERETAAARFRQAADEQA